jgi:signal transduction histidine kinase
VIRARGDEWETIAGEKELGTSMIRGITLSPLGGVWIVTDLDRLRVDLQGDQLQVVERLGPWIGVPSWMLFKVLEKEDGTLWMSGMTSAIQMPPHARQRPSVPPAVYVTGFRADGRDLSPDEIQALPATTRRIELSWAAPAYRDPASVRYQVRADSGGDWVASRDRSFRFQDLGPGNYRIEVRASLDGENWSAAPADFRFEIRSPLWQRPVFWAAMLALLAIGILLLRLQRTRQQVRLERQRTDIAMNLHDELGAGLGSIGLLTDLAASDEMEPNESREVATRVGEISRGLSRSLSDIVWTLRPASVDLPGFALFLRQRAADLLSAGDTVIEFDFPDPVPPIRLQLDVRRQIHAIASEALHNAAKHAQASRVCVSLDREGSDWVLHVRDDGVGFDQSEEAAGLGQESMRKRAAAIGADFSVQTGENGGCDVELRFRPSVGDR